MYQIIIYGTGTLANYLTNRICRNSTEIVAYVLDKGYGTSLNDIPILDINTIHDIAYDYIIIGFSNITKGKKRLLDLGVPSSKIVAYMPTTDYDYLDSLHNMIADKLAKDYNNDIIPSLFDISRPTYNLCRMSTHSNGEKIFSIDYVREKTLALISEQIAQKELEGAVAELGVFKGEFSREINKLFPDRTIYLFDTFDGFSEKDVKSDGTVLSVDSEMGKWHDTSVEKVLSILPYREKAVIKKGFFPDTYNLDNEQKFVFVSIDVDLYEPIYAGLSIFYPKLSMGGYIMIHDYNSEGYAGTKKAVDKYCAEHGISLLPIPDNCGTAIITK